MKIVKKNIWIGVFGIFLLLFGITTYFIMGQKEETLKQVSGKVLSANEDYVLVEDENDVLYKFKIEDFILEIGDDVVISYTGLLDSNKDIQDISIKDYSKVRENKKENHDLGLFKDYYSFAQKKLETMTIDEKISQLLLVQMPSRDAANVLKQNQFGGYLLFSKDFKDKTKEETVKMIQELQEVSKIPAFIAVDEEGGSVVRVSSNPNLAQQKFLSPSELYQDGGLERIKQDTVSKSLLLSSLGINLNLAPVVDVATNPSDYMYPRSLQENTETTAKYAKTVIEASKGGNVSYTLKHFPGYGNNADTHTNSVTDSRTYESIVKNDLPPFEEGIKAKAEAVLVSHNIVTNIDSNNPASLSPAIHNILRSDLDFTGVIITDDLTMKALNNVQNPVSQAVLAGNDLLIVSDYENAMIELKEALENQVISEKLINDRVLRILAWKYYKGMIYENQK